MKTRTILPLSCALALCACGGGGHSPTAPTGFTVVIATLLVCNGGGPTILDARLVVDGAVVADDASATPGLSALLTDLGGSLASGHHTLSVVIAAQTVSPSPYSVLAPDVSVFDATGARVKDIKLDSRNATLATGQSVDYTFDL